MNGINECCMVWLLWLIVWLVLFQLCLDATCFLFPQPVECIFQSSLLFFSEYLLHSIWIFQLVVLFFFYLCDVWFIMQYCFVCYPQNIRIYYVYMGKDKSSTVHHKSIYIVYTSMYIIFTMYILLWCTVHTQNMYCMCKCYCNDVL